MAVDYLPELIHISAKTANHLMLGALGIVGTVVLTGGAV